MLLNAESVHSEDDLSGNARPIPARYHGVINHAEEKGSKKKGTPGLDLEFQTICDGLLPDGKTKTSGQANRTIPLFLSFIGGNEEKTQYCINRVMRLAICCGVLRPGESKEPDWSEAVGRELVIEVVPGEEYEDDKGAMRPGRPEISFMGFWSLGNKEVANVPKDPTTPGMQQLAKAGGGNGAKAAATPATTAAASPSRSKFSDL